MKLTLHVWRQRSAREPGAFVAYDIDGGSPDMSFLELLDVLNERLAREGGDPIAFESDCREGICGACGFMINGVAHGPRARGTSEVAIYVRTSVSRGSVEVYRVTSAGISRVSEAALDLDRPSDRERYDALLRSGRRLPVEYCKLLDYRRDPTSCWKPGLGLP